MANEGYGVYAPYLPQWGDLGGIVHNGQALAAAGNALNAGTDPATVRNNLLAANMPGQANSMQNWNVQQQNQDRQNAQDAEAAKLKANVTEVGSLAADGTPEALAAARQRAFQLGMMDQAGALDTMYQKAKGDIASKVGAYAANTNEQQWNESGLPLLKQYGIDPTGYEGEPGRMRAAAEGGYGPAMFKANAASDLQDLKTQGTLQVQQLKADASQGGGTGTAFMKNTEYVKTAYPGIDQATAEQYAANPRLFKVQTVDTGTGQPTYNLTKIDAGTKSGFDAADRIARENTVANTTDGGNRPTNFADVLASLPENVARGMNAQTRRDVAQFNTNPAQPGSMAYVRTPEGAQAVGEGRSTGAALGKSQVQQAERIAPLSQINDHINQAIEDANNAESKNLFGRLAMSPTVRGVKETLRPGEVQATLGRRNVISAVENLREEVQRFYRVQGAGALTDMDKGRVDNIMTDLERSPNAGVFTGQLEHLRGTLNAIAGGATAKDVLNNPDLQRAHQQSGVALGKEVTGQPSTYQPGATGPRRFRYDPQTHQAVPIQ